ncbi:hypothetical protein [uncultured Methanobrevibacter sp.]|uniref:hypothetical protein n=1 Tax=uncultured Methanobrevibacter sp. TaxID=253161 RepID=UPI0025D9A8CC|nr:hypothetical protein [uncultured Methanobrevibacter sp.]
MELKKIILIIGIICVIIIGVGYLYTANNHNDNSTQINNTTNITKNITNTTNNTLNNSNSDDDEKASSSKSESVNNEPESSSKSYVEKWDESQQGDDDWAYTHDQPVKKGDDGKEYKRVYDEDSGKSSWQSTDSSDYEN